MLHYVIIHIIHHNIFTTNRTGSQGYLVKIQSTTIRASITRTITLSNSNLSKGFHYPIIIFTHTEDIYGGYWLGRHIRTRLFNIPTFMP